MLCWKVSSLRMGAKKGVTKDGFYPDLKGCMGSYRVVQTHQSIHPSVHPASQPNSQPAIYAFFFMYDPEGRIVNKALAWVDAHTFRARMSWTWTVTWIPWTWMSNIYDPCLGKPPALPGPPKKFFCFMFASKVFLHI